MPLTVWLAATWTNIGLIVGHGGEAEIIDDAAAEGDLRDGLGEAQGHEVIGIIVGGDGVAVHRAEVGAVGSEGGGGAGGEAVAGDVEEGDGADRQAEIDLGAAAGGVVGQGARGEQGRLAGGEGGAAGEAGALGREAGDAGR